MISELAKPLLKMTHFRFKNRDRHLRIFNLAVVYFHRCLGACTTKSWCKYFIHHFPSFQCFIVEKWRLIWKCLRFHILTNGQYFCKRHQNKSVLKFRNCTKSSFLIKRYFHLYKKSIFHQSHQIIESFTILILL